MKIFLLWIRRNRLESLAFKLVSAKYYRYSNYILTKYPWEYNFTETVEILNECISLFNICFNCFNITKCDTVYFTTSPKSVSGLKFRLSGGLFQVSYVGWCPQVMLRFEREFCQRLNRIQTLFYIKSQCSVSSWWILSTIHLWYRQQEPQQRRSKTIEPNVTRLNIQKASNCLLELFVAGISPESVHSKHTAVASAKSKRDSAPNRCTK